MNPSHLLAKFHRTLRWVATLPIRFYRRFISPMIAPRCRYAPSCSTYALEAIEVHGLIKGTILGVWRLLRCNPWSHGGVDHVPPKGRWKPEPWIPPDDWAGNATDIERPLPMGLDTLISDGRLNKDDRVQPSLADTLNSARADTSERSAKRPRYTDSSGTAHKSYLTSVTPRALVPRISPADAGYHQGAPSAPTV